MNQIDPNFLHIFIDESREHLSGIEDDLLALEKAPAHTFRELTDRLFRAVHTIKGSGGIFGFTRIKELAHGMENILGFLREERIIPNHETITILLDSADTLRFLIDNFKDSNSVDITELLSRLNTLVPPPAPPRPVSSAVRNVTEACVTYTSPVFSIPIEVNTAAIRSTADAQPALFFYCIELDSARDVITQLRSETDVLNEISSIAGIIAHTTTKTQSNPPGSLIAVLCATSLMISNIAELLTLPPERIHSVNFTKVMEDHSASYNNAKTDTQPVHAPDPEETRRSTSKTAVFPHPVDFTQTTQQHSLRVNITTLDHLMTLAGEMVLTRNELMQTIPDQNMNTISRVSKKVDSITSELQEAIIATRMLSVGTILNRFRRYSRDMALHLNKKIALEIQGEDVELDKSIIEMIGDPLMHIVRNAIDHGIEPPEERIRQGKDAKGSLKIAASQEGGQVLIEIRDDGRGIDPEIIRAKAKDSSLIDQATLDAMNDDEVIRLIFKAGFSTASTVTDLSGRGVGMDVVQSNLKRIGGIIDIHSLTGEGTTFRIKLPLTLAIIPALLISVEDERYAIAQNSIEELVRIPAAEVKNRLEILGGAPVLHLRDELLPLIKLNEILGINKTYIENSTGLILPDRRQNISDRRTGTDTSDDLWNKRRKPDRRTSHTSALNIVVVAAGEFKYGIIVDQLIDSAEIVVKPLGTHFSECREYAGATILGDGQVSLILDVIGIRRLFEMNRTTGSIALPERSTSDESNAPPSDMQSFLLIENGVDEFFALPAGLITRIERIKAASISSSGGKSVINFRNTTLRLIAIEDTLQVKQRPESEFVYVVILQAGGNDIGIPASNILDTKDIPVSDVDSHTHVTQGVLGSAFIHDNFTLFLNVFGMVQKTAPELLKGTGDQKPSETPGRILILEDSEFFRRQICYFIRDAGFETICCKNGAEGLSYLDKEDQPIDVILTDIEMPVMNGVEFTRAVRRDPRFKDIPIVAITSQNSESSEKKGLEAGINKYLEKFEREAVLKTCIFYSTPHRNKETA